MDFACQQQIEFLNLTEEELKLMSGYREVFTQEAPRIVDLFYDHTFKYAPIKKIIGRDHTTINCLKEIQKQYFISLLLTRLTMPT